MADSALTSTTAKLRRTLSKKLGNQASYTRLRDDRKAPTRSFKAGKPNRLKNLPAAGNYGVIPQERLMILDFDDHREGSWDIDDQIDFFSGLLEVNLRDSLGVITQSGGVHVYLMLPDSVRIEDIQTLPKASLRGYNSAFSQMMGEEIKLDADIRTSAVNAYVVGPTSSINFEDKQTKYNGYMLANESFGFKNLNFDILTISNNGFLKLQEAAAIKRGIQVSNSASKITEQKTIRSATEIIEKELLDLIPTLPEWAEEVSDESLIHGKPDLTVMGRLRKRVLNDQEQAFHKKRALVKASLHCCYDDYSIALACSMLGIDKDSYRGDSIGFSQLMRDVKRFKPSVRYHGTYCHKGHQQAFKRRLRTDESIEFNLEEFTKKKKEWIERKRSMKPSGMVNPRVLDVGKISDAIIGESRKKKPSQQYFDAMNIVNHYVQPLSNVGALRILLAHSDVSRSLNLSSSRVRQAMRVLRDRKILQIAEKQKTGMAASYVVSETFQHDFLTKNLKLTWGKYNSDKSDNRIDRSIYFDSSDGTYKTVFGNEIVEPIKDFSELFTKMVSGLPELERQGAGAATRYLRTEGQALQEIAALDAESQDINTSNEQNRVYFAGKLEDINLEEEDQEIWTDTNTVFSPQSKVQIDGIVLPENYELWDAETVFDMFSGELKKLSHFLTNDSG